MSTFFLRQVPRFTSHWLRPWSFNRLTQYLKKKLVCQTLHKKYSLHPSTAVFTFASLQWVGIQFGTHILATYLQ